MKKYFSFIIIAAISFLLNIFTLFNIQFNFKSQLVFVELMMLVAIIITIKLYRNPKPYNFLSVLFFMVLTLNSLYIFVNIMTILPTVILLLNLYGFIYFLTQREIKKKRKIQIMNKEVELERQIGSDTDEIPKVIIENKKFVAGKRGKFFYLEDSIEAKRIKPGNKVYFETKAQAKKAGYKSK